MNTQTFQIFGLRGMDERWRPEAVSATLITDMAFDERDAWKDAGGYKVAAQMVQEIRGVVVDTGERASTTGVDSDGFRTTKVFVGDKAVVSSTPSLNRVANSFFSTTATGRIAFEEQVSGYQQGEFLEIDTIFSAAVTHARGHSSRMPSGQVEQLAAEITKVNPFVESTINSLHWFTEHNGSRQWLVWDDSAGNLFAFDGSLAPYNPPYVYLQRYTEDGVSNIDDRVSTGQLGMRSQSVAWGGRLYIVNGKNDPLVFDGDKVEVAGFSVSPSAPTAHPVDSNHGNTVVFSIQPALVDGLYRGGISKGTMSLAGIGLGSINEASGEAKDGHQQEWLYDKGRICGYKYKVTFLNERGQESPLSEESNVAAFNNKSPSEVNFYYGEGEARPGDRGRGFIRVELPIGGPSVVARRIYRSRNMYDSKGGLVSLGRGEDFYLLDEVQDNITTSYTDVRPDTALANLVEDLDFGAWPPGTSMLATFKNTMFVAGSGDNTVRFSAPLFPEVFPLENMIIMSDDDNGPITGMYASRNALVVFKSRGIYLVKGDPASGFYADTLTKDVGCIAPDSIADVPGVGLVFLSDGGVYALTNYEQGVAVGIVKLSTPIPNTMAKINWSSARLAASGVYSKDRELWISVPMLGSQKNDTVLIYHYDISAWSIREDFPIGSMVVTRDHRGYLFFGNNDPSVISGLMVYSRGFEQKGIVDIDPYYSTADFDFGAKFKTAQPAHVIVYAVAHGNNDLTLNYRQNRSLTEIRGTRQGVDQQDPNDRFAVYADATFGSGLKWAKLRPTTIRFDISTTHVGPTKELQLSLSPLSRNVQIIGYDLEVKLGEQRNIKPLNEALAPQRR